MRTRHAQRRLATVAAAAAVVAALAGCTTTAAPGSNAVPSSAATPSTASLTATPPMPSPSAGASSGPADSAPASSGSEPAVAQPGDAADQTAVAVLATLEVKGRAPRTGYSREQFGDGWVDTDHNGCDSRNDVLARDLTGETFKPGTRDCVVATGTLADPYSGRTSSSPVGRTLPPRCRSTTSSPSPMRGRRAPSSGTAPSGSPSPTMAWSCWRWTVR
jgi:hypothetical protein